MEGYKDGKPDVEFWRRQITLGNEYRRINAYEDDWGTFNSYYRNEFFPGLFHKNIFFMMRRTMVPKIYFRNPRISNIPLKPGPAHAALAKIMNQVDNLLVNSMGLKVEMKDMVNSAFNTGTGILKIGFGAQYSPTPLAGVTSAPLREDTDKSVEYEPGFVQNMPWVRNVELGDFVLADGCKKFYSSFFMGHRIIRFRDDIESDERFKDKLKKRDKSSILGGMMDETDFTFDGNLAKRETSTLYEVRDRRTKQVMIFAFNDADEAIYHEDDSLQTAYSSPFYNYTPNPDSAMAYGIPDARILLPYQDQLNEIRTKKHQHIKLSIVKLLVESKMISKAEQESLLSDEVGAVVQVASLRGVQPMEVAPVPASLLKAEEDVVEDAREAMGFSRNSLAQYQARSHGPTATETNIVRQAAELRTDERRDFLSDVLTNIFRDLHLIVFRHWTKPQIVRVIGNDNLPVWVQFTGRMLQEGDYEIRIDPDSAVSETADMREDRARSLYQELANNPHIDGRKLTQYRLSNTSGIGADDLMSEQNPAAQQNGAPGNVLSMDEFINRESGAA